VGLVRIIYLDESEPRMMLMKRTKIVATLGPSSSTPEEIESLIQNGVDIVRLNFSHGTHEEHGALIRIVREISRKLDRPVGILQDLQGPKIRIGIIQAGKVRLEDGQTFTITTHDVPGTETIVSTTYTHLPKDVKPGDPILVADGLLEFQVISVEGDRVVCRVTHGGILESHKGVNLPGSKLSTPSLTDKDKKDLAFGLEQGVDFVALSFVRTPEDVAQLKELIRKSGADIPVISKIEKPEAVESIDEIIAVTDAIMVARGDLGVEMKPEKVPFTQKVIIDKCIHRGIPVITATQMLETMRDYPTPTRAETSDVANAILDGTDAVMLSGETASGKYPVESVRMMSRIIHETESHLKRYAKKFFHEVIPEDTFPDTVSQAACEAAYAMKAKAIIAFTQSGLTGRLISKYRPFTPIIAFTSDDQVRTRLLLNWGVRSYKIPMVDTFTDMIREVETTLLSHDLVSKDDIIVICAGAPLGSGKVTNAMMLHRIGN